MFVHQAGKNTHAAFLWFGQIFPNSFSLSKSWKEYFAGLYGAAFDEHNVRLTVHGIEKIREQKKY